MRLLWKYIRNYFLVYHLISHFLLYLQNYKEFEAKILDLQSEKYGLSFDIKKYTTSGWALGDENVIGVRAFKQKTKQKQNKTKQKQNKKKLPFQNGVHMTEFRFASFLFRQKFEEPLSQRNFSMKFGS